MEQILTPARLRVLRHAKGMSQAQLARNLDIQRSYISQFENGKYILGDDVLRAMLESLGGYPDVADEIDESDGYTVQDLSSDTLKLRDDFLIPPGLDNNLVEDALQEFHEQANEAWVLLEEEVPECWFFGIDEESADLIQHRALVSMARCFVLVQKLRGFEVCEMSDDSIGKRMDRETVKLT